MNFIQQREVITTPWLCERKLTAWPETGTPDQEWIDAHTVYVPRADILVFKNKIVCHPDTLQTLLKQGLATCQQ